MTFGVKKTANTHIVAEVRGMGNRTTVGLVLWFAKDLQLAVDAGMSQDTEVLVNKAHMVARQSLSRPIEEGEEEAVAFLQRVVAEAAGEVEP